MRMPMLLLSLLTISGCTAPVGAANMSIPPDAATQCESQCRQMGLRCSAVAVMAGTIGCVCETAPKSTSKEQASVTSAGMATLLMQEQQAQHQRQQRERASR